MKYLTIALLAIAAASGCTEHPQWATDQELRQEMFFRCLGELPAGPESTQYNDWAEVVDECGSQAYSLARVCIANCPPIYVHGVL